MTVAHLVARKRHADVAARAVDAARRATRSCATVIVGDGPERARARARSPRELGVADRVEFTGQLAHDEALAARARAAHVFVMPSVDEAFGVAYVEAMAAGCRRSARARRARAGGDRARRRRASGSCRPATSRRWRPTIDALLAEPGCAAELGAGARATVAARFTWERCGRATVAAYEEALR